MARYFGTHFCAVFVMKRAVNRNSGLYLGREDTDDLGIQERDDDAYDIFSK
jgi:hypothetical protein